MTRKRRKAAGETKDTTGAISSAMVLQAFKDMGKPLSRRELLGALRVGKELKEDLHRVLSSLEHQGRIIKIKGAWGLTESLKLMTGKLQMQRSGVAFVLLDEKGREDIFIRPFNLGDARHGDRVAVALLPGHTGRRPEGRVARVVERASDEITAKVERKLGKNLLLCQPTDHRQQMSLMIDTACLEGEIKPGDILWAKLDERLELNLWSATATQNFGPEDDVAVQEALVKVNHSIPTAFPAEVLAEAEVLPGEPSEEEFAGRRDLRDMMFVTIDGAKARDFDDAVYVEERGRGWTLWVAIADVAHYVRPGSALDTEAAARANSYYFPQSVEPMFPVALSNGLCSLNPQVPRLAMVAEVDFDSKGLPGGTRFYNAVIRSKARLTYGQVNKALLLGDRDERLRIGPVLPMLETAEKLARAINARRKERGSLDFDLPEPELMFNIYGETVDIRPKVRHFGHQIVEEFMIAANEAVARHLTDLELPCLYRIHPEPDPDKIQALFDLLASTPLAEDLPEKATPKALQDLLAKADGTDMEFLVGRLVLRTMMQAKYSPENEGHFGLASECYCHFTSPIRRYADLVVHRSLKQSLMASQDKSVAMSLKNLTTLADHLSAQERVGMDAEREMLKRLTVLFLRDKEGGEFNGVISALTDFGFFVELREVMAEGLVRLSTLTDDYYAFIPERQELRGERTGRIFHLGQSVKVVMTEVNLSRLEVNLNLLEAAETVGMAEGRVPGRRPRGKKTREPKSARRAERSQKKAAREQADRQPEAAHRAEPRREEVAQEPAAGRNRRAGRARTQIFMDRPDQVEQEQSPTQQTSQAQPAQEPAPGRRTKRSRKQNLQEQAAPAQDTSIQETPPQETPRKAARKTKAAKEPAAKESKAPRRDKKPKEQATPEVTQDQTGQEPKAATGRRRKMAEAAPQEPTPKSQPEAADQAEPAASPKRRRKKS